MRKCVCALALISWACGSSGGGKASNTPGAGGSSAGTNGVMPAGTGGSSTSTAGSQSGTGGAKPPDKPPVRTVGNCDSLGKPNEWEEITPEGMTKDPPYDGALVVFEDPSKSGTIFVTGARSGIFKSSDCGSTFTKVNTGRNGDQIDDGLVWSAVIDPIQPDTMYALTGYGPAGLWKTVNGGKDWDNVLPMDKGMPGFVARVNLDPTNHEHLLINFHNDCTGGHTPVCMGQSKDGGKTWNVLDFPRDIKDAWGEGTAVLPIDETHWFFEYWELYYTPDAGKTWSEVSPEEIAAVQGDYFQTPDGTFYLATQRGVMRSENHTDWSLIPKSGADLDAIIGDGKRLYAMVGFQPPSDENFVYTATYDDPMTWSALETPGFPTPAVSGGTDFATDKDHHILYVAAQGSGLWRIPTE